MIFYTIAALAAAGAIIFLLLKMDIRKVLAFDLGVDVIATVALIIMFSGTFGGMMAAVLAGCIISAFLYILKRTRGYKKPVRKGVWFTWKEVGPNGASHQN